MSRPLRSDGFDEKLFPATHGCDKVLVSFEMRLLPSQKSELFLAIQKAGFDPSAFELRDADTDSESVTLQFRRTDFRFTITNKKGYGYGNTSGWRIQYSPGLHKWSSSVTVTGWNPQLAGALSTWFRRLKEETAVVDPWLAITKSVAPDIRPSVTQANTLFTKSERKSISKGLDEIRSLLLEDAKDSDVLQSYVIDTLDRLVDNSEKLGRKDWLLLAIGSMMTLVTSVGCTPQVTENIWRILRSALSGIIQLGPYVFTAARHLGS